VFLARGYGGLFGYSAFPRSSQQVGSKAQWAATSENVMTNLDNELLQRSAWPRWSRYSAPDRTRTGRPPGLASGLVTCPVARCRAEPHDCLNLVFPHLTAGSLNASECRLPGIDALHRGSLRGHLDSPHITAQKIGD